MNCKNETRKVRRNKRSNWSEIQVPMRFQHVSTLNPKPKDFQVFRELKQFGFHDNACPGMLFKQVSLANMDENMELDSCSSGYDSYMKCLGSSMYNVPSLSCPTVRVCTAAVTLVLVPVLAPPPQTVPFKRHNRNTIIQYRSQHDLSFNVSCMPKL